MDKLKVKIELRDGKYPYFMDKNLDLTEVGDREKSYPIYISARLVKNENNEQYVEFNRVNEFTAKLMNAKMVRTEKGTMVIKHEPNSTLYVIELPSGYRGSVETKILNGECYESVILRSPRGSLGEVKHLYCNYINDKPIGIQYQISGRTRTVGYGYLLKLFGERLSGFIIIINNMVKIIFDEQLDQLLS